MISSVLYVSQSLLASPGLAEQLREIELAAIARNGDLNITGVLIAAPRYFGQFIEGDPDDVMALMDIIYADPRHRDVRVCCTTPLEHRMFAGWRMACFGPSYFVDRFVQPLLEKHHGQNLPPEAAGQLIAFMRKLVDDTPKPSFV
jgi:hypothetical protein